uniref:Uncharacterized protein n=1 Tax=Ceratitis capitata TaxID=7213 RepID=W8BTC9_CERCA
MPTSCKCANNNSTCHISAQRAFLSSKPLLIIITVGGQQLTPSPYSLLRDSFACFTLSSRLFTAMYVCRLICSAVAASVAINPIYYTYLHMIVYICIFIDVL